MSNLVPMKIAWQGTLVSIQPRTRVWRYLAENRTHYHLGYNLFLDGIADELEGRFVVAISEQQQFANMFSIGDVVQGTAWSKQYPEREYADFNRAGSLKHISRAADHIAPTPPPWIRQPPGMKIYADRGARMLSIICWKSRCFQCVWANMANVEILWDFAKRLNKYRFESFCYGPKSCKFYRMGILRSVPYKGRGTAIDDGSLDDFWTADRDYHD